MKKMSPERRKIIYKLMNEQRCHGENHPCHPLLEVICCHLSCGCIAWMKFIFHTNGIVYECKVT